MNDTEKSQVQLVLDALKQNPEGLTNAQIRDIVDIGGIHDRCIVSHILTRFYRLGVVTRTMTQQIGRPYLYQITGTGCDYVPRAKKELTEPKSSSKPMDAILDLVANRPGISSKEIKAEFGKSKTALLSYYHGVGLVRRERDEKQRGLWRYYPIADRQSADLESSATKHAERISHDALLDASANKLLLRINEQIDYHLRQAESYMEHKERVLKFIETCGYFSILPTGQPSAEMQTPPSL